MSIIIRRRRRRQTACGWWSCRYPSYAKPSSMCPICKRPKHGPPEEKRKR